MIWLIWDIHIHPIASQLGYIIYIYIYIYIYIDIDIWSLKSLRTNPSKMPNLWSFHLHGVPNNGWFIRENPWKSYYNRWFGGTAIFGNLHVDLRYLRDICQFFSYCRFFLDTPSPHPQNHSAQVQRHRALLTLRQPSVASLRAGRGFRQQRPHSQAWQRPAPAAPGDNAARHVAPPHHARPCAGSAEAQGKAGQHGPKGKLESATRPKAERSWEILRLEGWLFFRRVQVVVMMMAMIHEIFLVLCHLGDSFNDNVWALMMAVRNILCMLWPLQPLCCSTTFSSSSKLLIEFATACRSSQHLPTTSFIGHFWSCV